MTTNQTIDGVPRELLEALVSIHPSDTRYRLAKEELRALLDGPAPSAEFKKIEMEHVMNALEDVRGRPVLTSNQCHDLARALNDRLLSPLQLLAMPAEYLAAAQPQGEPVATVMNQPYGMVFTDYKESAFPLGVHVDLYAEQPAPVAVVMPDRHILRDAIAQAIGGDAYDCVRVWSAWGVGTMSEEDFVPVVDQEDRLYEIADACLDELKRLNTARPLHANPPTGAEPSGTHPHNDGLDEWRKPAMCDCNQGRFPCNGRCKP